jgi:hypothetical protein
VVIVSAAPDALPPDYRGLAAAVLRKPVGLAQVRATVAAAAPGKTGGTG